MYKRQVIDLLDEGMPVDLFYFDFRKAFDTVPHNRLLLKLKSLGIEGKLLLVLDDFLTDRTFRVSVEGNFSKYYRVFSGIPQGSVLGPLLFLLFVNDLPKLLQSKVKLFADDLKLIANSGNRAVVENDLKVLESWENDWLLRFNTEKCKVVHIDLNSNPQTDYNLNGNLLAKSVQEKDLGVLTSGTLLWNDQIDACIKKANGMICWIARNLISREKSLMLRVYKTIIRPHLEYCVQLWNPALEHGNWSQVLRLEGVQRRFTRMIDGVGLLPYSERLDVLELTTLAERRTRGDLIEVFKCKQEFSKLNGVFNFGRSRGNIVSKYSLSNDSKLDYIKRNFINERVKVAWNKLPSEVKNATSLNSFKYYLEKFKKESLKLGLTNTQNYWECSNEVLSRIECGDYLRNKEQHNEYLKLNKFAAKKKFINLN